MVNLRPRSMMPIMEKVGTCSFCNQETARWKSDINVAWCADCYLHESQWGQENHSEIIKLALEVGENLNRVIIFNDRVISSDSDRILSAIVFSSMYATAKMKDNKKKS